MELRVGFRFEKLEVWSQSFAIGTGSRCFVKNASTRGAVCASSKIPEGICLTIIQCRDVLCSPTICKHISVGCNIRGRTITICICGCGTSFCTTIVEVIGIFHQVANLLPATNSRSLFAYISVLQLHVVSVQYHTNSTR